MSTAAAARCFRGTFIYRYLGAFDFQWIHNATTVIFEVVSALYCATSNMNALITVRIRPVLKAARAALARAYGKSAAYRGHGLWLLRASCVLAMGPWSFLRPVHRRHSFLCLRQAGIGPSISTWSLKPLSHQLWSSGYTPEISLLPAYHGIYFVLIG